MISKRFSHCLRLPLVKFSSSFFLRSFQLRFSVQRFLKKCLHLYKKRKIFCHKSIAPKYSCNDIFFQLQKIFLEFFPAAGNTPVPPSVRPVTPIRPVRPMKPGFFRPGFFRPGFFRPGFYRPGFFHPNRGGRTGRLGSSRFFSGQFRPLPRFIISPIRNASCNCRNECSNLTRPVEECRRCVTNQCRKYFVTTHSGISASLKI